ncbi:MAG: hypothetical protein ACI4XM_07960 [Candidatus Coprovivens sp.]
MAALAFYSIATYTSEEDFAKSVLFVTGGMGCYRSSVVIFKALYSKMKYNKKIKELKRNIKSLEEIQSQKLKKGI